MIFQKAQKNNLVGVVGELAAEELEGVIGGAGIAVCKCSYPYKPVRGKCVDGKGGSVPCS